MISLKLLAFLFLACKCLGWTPECKEGEFRCNNSRICVPQERICNKIEDCPDKSDEIACVDEDDDLSWNHLFRKHPAADLDEHVSGCDLNWTSPVCACMGRAILCHHVKLQRPPLGLPPRGVHLLDLTGNNFPVLSEETMNIGLPSLHTLVLAHAGVKKILPGTFKNLPRLRSLYLSNNQLQTLPEPMFQPNNSLEVLILQYNKLSILPRDAFHNLKNLQELDLRHNLLQDIHTEVLRPLSRLKILYLSENKLQSVPEFGLLPELRELSLAHNHITWIEPGAFSHLPALQHLYLSWNNLWLLKNNTFIELKKLRRLSLNENQISVVEISAFNDLPQLKSLDLQRNKLKQLKPQVLQHLNLDYIYFDAFNLCSAALHVRVCEPKGDGISSLHHLLDNIVLRTSVWVMAVLACAGNAIVLLGRLVAREPNPVHSLYIKTLALADFLMGVYLLLIAAADWHYRDIYIQHEYQWRQSIACSICGFLSTLSCESSVLILTLITRDRLVSVTRPLDRCQTSLRRATLLVTFLWIVAAVVALLPLSSETRDYFGDEFYGGNGVCLPLHIQDQFAQGWEYSAAMFIVLNTVALMFISYAYWRMFLVVRSSGLSLRSTQERQDRAVAQRFIIIIVTDCLCWIPVIVVKLTALAGVHVDQQLSAWLAILVLPVNSALNPVLYTLTTSIFKNQISRFLHACKSRDTVPSHDSGGSLNNLQLSVRKHHGSQQTTRSSTLRSHGSWRSMQGTTV